MYINIFPVQIYTADKAMDKLPPFVQRPIVQNIFRPDQGSPGSIQALGGRLLYGLRQGFRISPSIIASSFATAQRSFRQFGSRIMCFADFARE